MAFGPPERWADALRRTGATRPACVYAGRSAEVYLEIRRTLDDYTDPTPFGPLVNELVDEFWEQLLGFDEVLDYRDSLLWHAGDLAERNQSFIHRCAAVLACDRLFASRDRDLLIVVDDPALRTFLVRLARSRGLAAEALGERGPLRGRAWWRAIRERVSFVLDHVRRRRLLRRLGAATPSIPERIDALVATWADSHTFPPGAPLERDTYFGELPRLLRSQRQEVAYLAIPLSWVEPAAPILRNALASPERVLLPEQCSTSWDALRIALRSLARSARLRRPYVVGGVDLTPVLVDELRRDRLRVRRCFALQFECVARTLSRDGVSIARILHPFENQSWEKVLRLAVRTRMPATRLVGYQTSHIEHCWFSYYPSRRDLAEGQLPDDVVVFGCLWERLLAEHGYPQERMKLGPALRYAKAGQPRPERARSRPLVLVAASIGLDEALELAWKAVTALAREADVDIVIGLHPKMAETSRERFSSALLRAAGWDALPRHVVLSVEPTEEHLADASVLLYSSTVLAFQAIAAGVVPVLVQSDFWLDMNSLPRSHVAVTRTPSEIGAAVRSVLEQPERVREHWRAEMSGLVADALAPLTAETLEALIPRD